MASTVASQLAQAQDTTHAAIVPSQSTCYESSVMSPAPFMGNNGEIFKLCDDSFWKVMYEYEYLYEYYPSVVVCPGRGTLVIGSKTLQVQQISAPSPTSSQPPTASVGSVIESRIDGDFSGWDGETVFKLTNGQIWEQASYSYAYHDAYSPQVVIYPSGGEYRLHVEGMTETIAVRRLK